MAYPNDRRHRFAFLPRLKPYPVRGHRLLQGFLSNAHLESRGSAALYHNSASRMHPLMHLRLMQCDVVTTPGRHGWALCVCKSRWRWSCCAAAAVTSFAHTRQCCCSVPCCAHTAVTIAAAAPAPAPADRASSAQTSLDKPTVADVCVCVCVRQEQQVGWCQ